VYWIFVVLGFLVMRYRETTGHLPFFKAKKIAESVDEYPEQSSRSSGVFESGSGSGSAEKKADAGVREERVVEEA
jgi:high-affinity iron transporter